MPLPLWMPDPPDLEHGVYVLVRRDGQPSGWRFEYRPPAPRRPGIVMRLLMRIWGRRVSAI
jgi:hypothetical protein